MSDLLSAAVKEVRETYEALRVAERERADVRAHLTALEKRCSDLAFQLDTQERRLALIARGQIDMALDIALNKVISNG
jgi:hypothetical protein